MYLKHLFEDHSHSTSNESSACKVAFGSFSKSWLSVTMSNNSGMAHLMDSRKKSADSFEDIFSKKLIKISKNFLKKVGDNAVVAVRLGYLVKINAAMS